MVAAGWGDIFGLLGLFLFGQLQKMSSTFTLTDASSALRWRTRAIFYCSEFRAPRAAQHARSAHN